MSGSAKGPPAATWGQLAEKLRQEAAQKAQQQTGTQQTAPPPRTNPAPAPSPPATTSSKPVAPCTDPMARGWPLGFDSEDQFNECMRELMDACDEEGIDAEYVGVRGSAATYASNNPHKKGQHFDSKGPGRSDIDVFFVTSDFLKDPCRPSKDKFVHPDKVKEAYPKIAAWNQKWSKKLGREVTAGAFKPNAPAMSQPKIEYP